MTEDFRERNLAILARIAGYTMTSIERQIALITTVRHISRRRVPGVIVECGVWRGGSSMAAALVLIGEQDVSRGLYLYDTFEGMTTPTQVDTDPQGTLAQDHLDRDPARSGKVWAVAGMEAVRANMASTGYPADKIHLVKGPVETTLPSRSPAGAIALLRLDTDWYESTRHELEHLFPLVSEGGVLILDDYGHWQGARKAVDEYFAAHPRQFESHQIDYTGLMVVKR